MEGAIAVTLFGITWWGLVRYWRGKGKGTVVRHIGGFFGGFFVLIVVAAVLGGAEKKVEGSEVAAVVPSTAERRAEPVSLPVELPVEAEAKAVPTLDLTPAQYAKRFNSYMAELDMPYRIKPVVTTGSVNNVFSSVLNDHLVVNGVIDKVSGKMTGVMFLGTGDGTPESGLNVMMTSVAVFAAAVPEGSIKTMTPEVLALFKQLEKNEKETATRTFNNVKLFYSRSKVMGNWFGAEAI